MNENTKKLDDYYTKKDLSLSTLSSVLSYDDYTTDDQKINGCKYLKYICIMDGEAFLSFKGTTYQKARYLYLVMKTYPKVGVIEDAIFEYDMKRDTGTFSWPKQSITTPLQSMMIDGAYCLCGDVDADIPYIIDGDIESYQADIKRFVLIEDTGNDNDLGDVVGGVMKSIINSDVVSKPNLARIIENTFSEFIKNDRTTVNYTDEAKKYLDYMLFLDNELDLRFKQKHYPNVKYIILYYQHPDSYYQKMSFVVVYDYVKKFGKIIVFTGSGDFRYSVGDVSDWSNNNNKGISSYYERIDVDNFPTHDDSLENADSYQYFRYIKFIDSANEESLMGCLMDFFAEYKLSGYVKSNGSNTITHYAPIEAGQEISSFKVGKPVSASGSVYKRVDGKWLSSTVTDRYDCICSVLIDGSYKEFVGVITEVDEPNGCVTFASHGDMLFTVDDANLYQIGDVILFNGKILDEDYAMTLRIQQSIVGKVTGKINETTIALFRS